MKTIDGKNYYNIDSLNEIINELEHGNTVHVVIDCIGHTRNNNEQECYKESLIELFGEKLDVNVNMGTYSYSYIYKLK